MNTLKRVLALSLALIMAMSVGVFAFEYTDSDDINEDCQSAIDLLYGLNIMQGDPDGSFRPNDTLTRAEVTKMVFTLRNGANTDASAFKELNRFADIGKHWARGYINYCYDMGYVFGKTATTFDPDAPITGVELATILLRVAGYDNEKQGYSGKGWATNVLNDAYSAGLLNFYELQTAAPAQRQWAAVMFETLINEVQMAEYRFGELFVGGLNGNGPTVGAKLLGLHKADFELVENNNMKAATGSKKPVNTIVLKDKNGSHPFKYEMTGTELLGQTVTVYFKNVKVTEDSTGKATYNLDKATVINVTDAGVSDVYTFSNYDLSKITNDAGADTGKIVVSSTVTLDVAVSSTDDKVNYVCNNIGGSDVLKNIFALGTTNNVKVIVNDDDDKVDYIFVDAYEYKDVTAVNASYVTVNGSRYAVKDIVFDGTEPVKGDVVAIQSAKIDNVAKTIMTVIEPVTGVKVSKWEGLSTSADAVIINGESYDTVVSGIKVTDTIFYIHNDYVVRSKATAESAGPVVPTDSVIITGISNKVFQVNVGLKTYESFRVQYMDINGTKSKEVVYDYTTKDCITYSGSPAEDQKAEAARSAVEKAMMAGALVRLIENDDGTVAFANDVKSVANLNIATQAAMYATSSAAKLKDAVSAEYDKDTNKLSYGGKNVYVEKDTVIFFATFALNTAKNGVVLSKVEKIAPDKLNTFGTSKGVGVAATINTEDGALGAVVLVGTAVPAPAAVPVYGMVTGAAVDSLGLDGKVGSYKVAPAIDSNGNSFDLITLDTNMPKAGQVFTFTKSSKCYTTTAIDESKGTLAGLIKDVDYDRQFVVAQETGVNGDTSRYYYTDDTVIFMISTSGSKTVYTALEAPEMTGNVNYKELYVVENADGDIVLMVIDARSGKDASGAVAKVATRVVVTNGTVATDLKAETAATVCALTPKVYDQYNVEMVGKTVTYTVKSVTKTSTDGTAATTDFDFSGNDFTMKATAGIQGTYTIVIEVKHEVTTGVFISSELTITGVTIAAKS